MNIREFSLRAGVSTATVSRAFHEPDKLTEATRRRILSLADELGYYPSPSGRALVRGRHDVLGVVWPLEVEGAEASFAQRILAALTGHLVKNDLDLLVCPLDRRESAALAHAKRTLQRSRCDAWILLYPRQNDVLTGSLKKSGKPVVCLMGSLPECPEWKCVQLNQKSWIDDALRRLKTAGCSNVTFFGSRPDEPDHEQRRKVFSECAPKYFGSRFRTIAGWPPDTGELRRQLLSGKCDAIIGVDDNAALLALEVCGKAGLSVPKDVKVAGIDNIPQARFALPSLTTYRQPLDEMAGCAVDLALGRRTRSRSFDAVLVPGNSL
jgi:DNA-binding LacI/PurR family transcriptional regulator